MFTRFPVTYNEYHIDNAGHTYLIVFIHLMVLMKIVFLVNVLNLTKIQKLFKYYFDLKCLRDFQLHTINAHLNNKGDAYFKGDSLLKALRNPQKF